nr:NmrA family NAD(P)-binding protein [uncultured Devosia sp.]
MTTKVLVIGASGRIGSKLVADLDRNSEGLEVRLATSRPAVAEKWRAEGRKAVVLDLNDASTFPAALAGIDRLFLLTGYTSDMLFQSKKMVDAAVDAGVSHIVHLGVFTSRRDDQPHFAWHDLIETYIEASGIAWTHLHPNVITDSILVTDPPVKETGTFTAYPNDVPVGWICADDIAAVAAVALREGPENHGGADYFLSVEVLRGSEVAKILSDHLRREIKYVPNDPADLATYVETISDAGVRNYMESAVITMDLGGAGKMSSQAVVRDDVQTAVGRPGMTMAEWARQNL